MSDSNNFSHSAAILPVSDLPKSIDFYTKKLGFEKTFEWGEPMYYAVVRKGGVGIHLTKRSDGGKPSRYHRALYIFVNNIDDVYKQCKDEQIKIVNDIEDRDYKMKDFDIEDPDGFIITFGKGD
ncbi:putative enzyme related to lactoylglutathione lyase [Christiangramia gaetbulicola]|uniref:Putative enzyme related to lactoylglutathione lyase n=1 Tax=Christiangramia gaetbulicola TaxID=703340 RepID=A0A2T6AI67_9FLAO|nr:glyoxalase superfamily protein [Christiangramia gaetbulicola]PTX43510.1 putative enzyme related to lactoylglutathione lyase [Christiangramia gaetbulicola]